MTAYKATIGADFSTQDVVIDSQTVALQIWDTAGQERFLSIGGAFYKGSDCCIIVYDVTQQGTFNAIPAWKKEFLEHTSIKDGEEFPIVLIGNKIDRDGARQVPAEKAKAWCKANGGIPYFETSAKTGTAVRDAFMAVAQLALKNRTSPM